MRKSLVLSCLLAMFATPVYAQPKPGQYTGVRQCTATAGSITVDATSKKTIGVANCKSELRKALTAKDVCSGKKKNEKVAFSFQFGKDEDKDKAVGDYYVLCSG